MRLASQVNFRKSVAFCLFLDVVSVIFGFIYFLEKGTFIHFRAVTGFERTINILFLYKKGRGKKIHKKIG